MSTSSSSQRQSGINRRRILAGLSLLCLTIGGMLWWTDPSDHSHVFLYGSLLKSAMVLFVAWLAFPQMERLPGWAFVGMILGLVAVATRPLVLIVLVRWALFAAPIFFLIWLISPRKSPRKAILRRRGRSRQPGRQELGDRVSRKR